MSMVNIKQFQEAECGRIDYSNSSDTRHNPFKFIILKGKKILE